VTAKPCPACESPTPTSQIAAYSAYRVLRCLDCGVAYVDDQRSAEQVQAAYDHDIYGDYLVPVADLEDKVADDVMNYFSTLAQPHLPQPARILDIGCGKGHFLQRLDPQRYQRHGLEPAQPLARHARDHFGLDNVLAATLAAADYPPDHFDAVTLWMVIEHIPEPAQLVRDIHRVLKPGGVLLISTPNFQSLLTCIARMLLAVSFERIKGPLARFLNTSHVLGFSPAGLDRLLQRHGFRVVAVLQDERYLTRHGLSALAPTLRILLKLTTRLAKMVHRQEAFVVAATKS
jgi:2-polyprenyl-3-methyl-5-hydroxy-6-metoxy-1,4-benzoquinol methylase